MKWLKYLWPWAHRERAEAEARTDKEFRAQLREAMLVQDDLLEAAANMKKAREERLAETPSFREALSSNS
jgi:hypothetical protein